MFAERRIAAEPPPSGVPTESRILSGADALREAMALCMERDERVFVMGQGVTDPFRVFGTTRGLLETYGPGRVVETPLAENGMTGVAIGAAISGQRPVLIHMRADFALLTMEQLVNNAAKTAWLTQGKLQVPLVVRMFIGRGWGQGPAHTQSLESLFAMIPGLTVVMPATPADAKGQLIAAIESPNPVIFLEHRWLHFTRGLVPAGHYSTPLDGPKVVRPGCDLTIAATSHMVVEALRAADALATAGISAEVVDVAVLRPFNPEPILMSVRRTGRLMVADTGWNTLGMGAEIIAIVTEQAFGALTGPPVRVGLPDLPAPSSPALAGDYYPTALTLFDRAGALLGLPPSRLAVSRNRLAALIAEIPVDVPEAGITSPF